MKSESKNKHIDRDLQRAHLIEESPRPIVDDELERLTVELGNYRDLVEPSKFKFDVIKKRKLRV